MMGGPIDTRRSPTQRSRGAAAVVVGRKDATVPYPIPVSAGKFIRGSCSSRVPGDEPRSPHQRHLEMFNNLMAGDDDIADETASSMTNTGR